MRELIVVGFAGKHRAAEVLGQLQGMENSFMIGLADAVAVYRTDDGRLRIDQSVQLTKHHGGAVGGVLGAIVGGLLAAATGGASVAATAWVLGSGALGAAVGATDAGDWKDRYGISDEYVKQVGGMVQPGQSAVFLLAESGDPDEVVERFRGHGGRILRTTLPAEQAQHIQQVMDTAPPIGG